MPRDVFDAIGVADTAGLLEEMAGSGSATAVASSERRCSACGHVQRTAGRCAGCGQLLVEPVSPELANPINRAVVLGESGAGGGRGLIGAMREGDRARARAEKARGRQWDQALAETDGAGREVDRDGMLAEMVTA